jgi:hypothetical protein
MFYEGRCRDRMLAYHNGIGEVATAFIRKPMRVNGVFSRYRIFIAFRALSEFF